LKVTLKFKYLKRVGAEEAPLSEDERNGLPKKLTIHCKTDLEVDYEAKVALRSHLTNRGLIIPQNVVAIFKPFPEDPSRSA
jgi:hypothetical protein